MSEPHPELSAAARRADALARRFGLSYERLVGFRFAVNVFLATLITWLVLKVIADTNPIWGIASMVASADPDPEKARRMFRSRLINVSVGCTIGFAFLILGGGSSGVWLLPLSLGVSVLVATNLVRIEPMWRQAPVTTAIVVAAGMSAGSGSGVESGVHKVAEVFFGCLVGVVVSSLMANVWLIPPPADRRASDAVDTGD
jgi:uncharacterized membrane protein YccC